VSLSHIPEIPHSRIWLGATYHPEQWPEERWPDDARLMSEAGLNVVRMADCSWSALEPTAGDYDFDWLERAIVLSTSAYRRCWAPSAACAGLLVNIRTCWPGPPGARFMAERYHLCGNS
jgi:beta-galactosidase GanA